MASSIVAPVFTTLVTAAEAAHNLKIHPVTLLRWARERRLPSVRLGRKVLFSPEQITSWLSLQYTDIAVRAASTKEREAA
jgi:excisionase family DNA binding protein